MFTDFIDQFEHIIQRAKDSPVLTDPWPHMYITEVFTSDFYRQACEFENGRNLIRSTSEGRTQTVFDIHSQYYQDHTEKFNDATSRLFDVLSAKFGYEFKEKIPCTTTHWIDTHKLGINDIHVDAFFDTKFTISGQIYLPEDDSQRHYGTRLYKYIGDNIAEDAVQDSGADYPHIVHGDNDNFKLVRTVPFMPNCMLVTTNEPNSWHQAPTNIANGDRRKSLMLRWKV